MPLIIPGGKIIGGMGGRIYTGPMGTDPSAFAALNATMGLHPVAAGGGTPGYIEVERWSIAREWINAECTHTRTVGAITRRLVAHDWHFQCSLPADQDNLPDRLLGFSAMLDNPEFVNTAIAFFLGDVLVNVEAVAMEMTQRYYFAPMCVIRSCQPVLDAARDVIRYQIAGEGNSRMFLMPDESADCTDYIRYLTNRGWWV